MKLHFAPKLLALIAINCLTAILIAGIVLKPENSSKTQAQVAGYSAVWTVTKCRVANVNSKVPIGPASWQVVYTIPGQNSIRETWDVPANGWRNFEYQGNSQFETQGVNDANNVCGQRQGYVQGKNYTSGLYSASGDSEHSTWSVASFPISWTVTSEVIN